MAHIKLAYSRAHLYSVYINNLCYTGRFYSRVARRREDDIVAVQRLMTSPDFRRIHINLRKSDYSLRHVCLSVCPHVTARLQLDGFSWNLILGGGAFTKNVSRTF